MTTLYLVRHGETDNNKSGCFNGCGSNQSLNETGKQQAACLAAPFAEIAPDVLYASPLARATETARALCGELSLDIIPADALREMDMGDFEGVPFVEAEKVRPGLLHDWFHHPDRVFMPNGERFEEVRDRAVAALAEIVQKNRGKRIAVVAHGALLQLALSAFLGLPIVRRKQIPHLHNTGYYVLEIEDDGEFRVPRFNCCDHLPPALQTEAAFEGADFCVPPHRYLPFAE